MKKASQKSQPKADQPLAENVKFKKLIQNLIRDQKLHFLLILLLFFISACDEGPPIPEEKFIKVYVDVLIAKDTSSSDQISVDSIKSLVFFRHGISMKDYEETIKYYNSSSERWEVFFDKAIAYVEELKTKPDSTYVNGK